MLARQFRKGLVLLLGLSFRSGFVDLARNDAARREVGFVAMFKKAIQLQPVILVILVLIVLVYFLIAFDAYKTANKSKTGSVLYGFLYWLHSSFWDGKLVKSSQQY